MDGIIIVDKPQGMTSHDVVDFMRRHFGFKKVGHAGTLDPMATGVLVMLIGKYTKQSDKFIQDSKEYDGTMTLGAVSDTGDAWGKVEPAGSFKDINAEDVDEVLKGFVGEIDQRPHAYSAVKINGKRLYTLARKGVAVEIPSRKISITDIVITNIDLPEISFKVSCSKGTYIRQLAVDIGEKLGCGAYLSKLRRTRSGRFMIEKAITVEELKNMKPEMLRGILQTI